MDIIQQAQTDTNGCSYKENAGGRLHHLQLYFLDSPFTALDPAHQMIYHLSGMSERIVITTREHGNQQNSYVCIYVLIFSSLLFFSLPFSIIFQVCPSLNLLWPGLLPILHSFQKEKL